MLARKHQSESRNPRTRVSGHPSLIRVYHIFRMHGSHELGLGSLLRFWDWLPTPCWERPNSLGKARNKTRSTRHLANQCSPNSCKFYRYQQDCALAIHSSVCCFPLYIFAQRTNFACMIQTLCLSFSSVCWSFSISYLDISDILFQTN